MKDKNKWLEKLSRKFNVSIKELETKLTEFKKKGFSEDRAIEKVRLSLSRSNLTADLLKFEGILLAATEPFDWASYKYGKIEQMMINRPDLASQQGYKKVNGVIYGPDDNKIPRNLYIRTFFGLAARAPIKNEDVDPSIKPIFMTVSGVYADPKNEKFLEPILKEPITFMAVENKNEKDKEAYHVRCTTSTHFEPWDEELPKFETLMQLCKKYYVPLNELKKNVRKQLIVTKGTVLNYTIMDNSNNDMVLLDDETLWSLEDDEDDLPPVTAWVPKSISLDGISMDTKCYVIGKVSLSKNGEPRINASGIIFLEPTVTPPVIKTEDLDFDEFGDDE